MERKNRSPDTEKSIHQLRDLYSIRRDHNISRSRNKILYFYSDLIFWYFENKLTTWFMYKYFVCILLVEAGALSPTTMYEWSKGHSSNPIQLNMVSPVVFFLLASTTLFYCSRWCHCSCVCVWMWVCGLVSFVAGDVFFPNRFVICRYASSVRQKKKVAKYVTGHAKRISIRSGPTPCLRLRRECLNAACIQQDQRTEREMEGERHMIFLIFSQQKQFPRVYY